VEFVVKPVEFVVKPVEFVVKPVEFVVKPVEFVVSCGSEAIFLWQNLFFDNWKKFLWRKQGYFKILLTIKTIT
jgi:hypothetical protein